MTHRLALMLFIIVVLAAGMASGYFSNPAASYHSFVKPSFAPPGWLFAPVWTVLYVLIATAGWLVWRRDAHATPMTLWWVQMALNLLWSPVFFSLGLKGGALIIIGLLLAAILGFIITAWQRDRLAALLFLPYAAWVGFAALLNYSIMTLN